MRTLAGILIAVFVVGGCIWEAAPDAPAVGPPQPAASFTCIGVPPVTCQQMLADARMNATPGTVVVRMDIRCTQRSCTLARGEAESTVVYSNGATSTMVVGWEGALPPGAP